MLLEDAMPYVPKRVMAHLSERFTRQLRYIILLLINLIDNVIY